MMKKILACLVLLLLLSACGSTSAFSESKALPYTPTENVLSSPDVVPTPEVSASQDLMAEFVSSSASDSELDHSSILNLYNELKDLYLSGNWDGTFMYYKDHPVEIAAGGGYLLSDCYILNGMNNLDLPDDFDICKTDVDTYQYVPGEGTYTIINQKLVKYVRGEQVEVEGSTLNWKGFEEDPIERPRLVYNLSGKTLYLLVSDPSNPVCDPFEDHLEELNNRFFVYVFPDVNKSEIEYLGVITYADLFEGAQYVNLDRLAANGNK